MSAKKVIKVFAGKGGVGKTTCAAATALHYAGEGYRTLALSTDPTPSLVDIFEISGNRKPAKVNEYLDIHELGLDEVKQMWDTRFGREVYEVFSSFVDIGYPEFVDFMTSLLPGLGEEFMVDYIREISRGDDYDAVIWDTAPLGQTLTLLETPALLHRHLRMAPRIYSKLRVSPGSREPVLDIIKRWERLSGENMDFLRGEVEFCIVTIAEALAVNQIKGVFKELHKYKLKIGSLVVNNVAKADGSTFLLCRAKQQQKYIESIYNLAAGFPIIQIPMFPEEIKGLDKLTAVRDCLFVK